MSADAFCLDRIDHTVRRLHNQGAANNRAASSAVVKLVIVGTGAANANVVVLGLLAVVISPPGTLAFEVAGTVREGGRAKVTV